jgi:hypothetical protein
MTSLGKKGDAGPILGPGAFALEGENIDAIDVGLDEDVGNPPRLDDRFDEEGTRIATPPRLVGTIAANADDEKEGELQVVNDVPKRVAGLEQARALNDDDRPFAAEEKSRRDGDCLAFPTDADERQAVGSGKGGVPGPELAVGEPDDVRDADSAKCGQGAGSVPHGDLARRVERMLAGFCCTNSKRQRGMTSLTLRVRAGSQGIAGLPLRSSLGFAAEP